MRQTVQSQAAFRFPPFRRMLMMVVWAVLFIALPGVAAKQLFLHWAMTPGVWERLFLTGPGGLTVFVLLLLGCHLAAMLGGFVLGTVLAVFVGRLLTDEAAL